MEAKTTKEKIIFESLKLFSKDGYESTSTRAIARSINCSDAVIYKHFKSKQEILDEIIKICTNRFVSEAGKVTIDKVDWDTVENVCLGMFEFQTTDEWIVPFRRLVTIEQFKNEKLAAIYQEVFINRPLENMEEIFKGAIALGYMKPGNTRVYAMDLYSPFFMYHTIGGDKASTIKVLKEHVKRFIEGVAVL